MKLVTFTRSGEQSYGSVDNDIITDIGQVLGNTHPDLKSLIGDDYHKLIASSADAAPRVALSDDQLLPPITNPDKIICVGLNYESHRKETGRPEVAFPTLFTRFANTQIGDGEAMWRPAESTSFDYEGELAVIIGSGGWKIPEDTALEHVAGYSCYNDGSVRDWQRHTSQFWGGKNFDRSGSMGPWLVTPDELGDPTKPTMVTRLNGEVMQETSVGDLAFQIPDLISYISTITELVPGDVIATGTPSGVGLFRDPKVFMKPGDRIEVEISGIGTLRNVIAEEH